MLKSTKVHVSTLQCCFRPKHTQAGVYSLDRLVIFLCGKGKGRERERKRKGKGKGK
jgi:hypothetical protein